MVLDHASLCDVITAGDGMHGYGLEDGVGSRQLMTPAYVQLGFKVQASTHVRAFIIMVYHTPAHVNVGR